ncbi:MAG: PLDc N-terminal domain-containing protein [Acidiferrobacter sp.]
MSSYSLIGTVVVVLDAIAIIGILLGSARIGHKVVWIVAVVVFPFVGMVMYYLIGRSPRDA